MAVPATLLATLIGLWVPVPALFDEVEGAGEGVNVVVRCLELSAEASSSVEARARADLIAQGVANGLLVLGCGEGDAQAAWIHAGEEPKVHRVPLAASEGERVDQLVALAAEAVGSAPQSGSAAAVAPLTAAPAAPPTPAPPVVSPPPPAAAAPATRDKAGDSRAATSTSVRRAAIVVGPSFEFWGGETLGALGVRAGVALPVERVYAVLPTLAYEAALKSPDGIAVRQLFAALEVSREFGKFLLLDVGIAGSFMTFAAPAGVSPATRTSVVPVFVAGAAVPVRWGASNQAVFGLGMRAYEFDRAVTLDNQRVLRVPAFALVLVTDLHVGL